MTLSTLSLLVSALLILGGAVAALCWRNLVHCALALAVSFLGLAILYLRLHAQFLGLAQVLIYVGAVAILMVFAALLTRGAESASEPRFSPGAWVGAAAALAIFLGLARALSTSSLLGGQIPPAPQAPVRELGQRLMTDGILPLELTGLLLTVALVGGVLLARPERPPN